MGKRRLLAVLAAAAAALLLGPAAPPAAQPAPPAAAPETPIARQVLSYVERLYVEPGLLDPRDMLLRAVAALEARYPEVIADTDAPDAMVLHLGAESLRLELGPTVTLAEVAELLERLAAFAGPRLPDAGGEGPQYVALRGALGALDPHTALLSPEQLREFATAIRGTFGGIGIVFNLVPEGIAILEVFPGSPAAGAGLAAGEVITAVGESSAAGPGAAAAAQLVRGEIGSTVELNVRAAGGARRTVRVVRASITERSVSARTIADDGAPPVLLVAITGFQQETGAQLREALAGLATGSAGVVLDLRGNAGGLLDAAVATADRFLDAGPIVSVRDRSGRPTIFSASPFGIVERRPPLVVLINRASASAAEVLAAALKESRALLIGETSYGKGSVQKNYPLDDGGALLLTIQHYYTPGDVSIQARGVEPDLLLTPLVLGERPLLGGSASHPREAGLQNAFAARGAAGSGPALRLTWLREPMPGTGAPALAPRSEDDAAVRAAVAILREAATADGSRAGLLAAAGPVVAAMAREEERKIVAALARRGVDWGAADPPAAAAGPGLVVEPLPESRLDPGASTRVVVRVRNAGAVAARRVWGRTASSNPPLAGLDLLFGAIGPGETREAGVDVVIPPGSPARWDPYDLEIREGDGPVVATARGAARTPAGTRPALAHTLTLADVDPLGRRRGGDGTLDPGERLVLTVRLATPGTDAGPVDLRLNAAPADAVSVVQPQAQIEPGGAEAAFDCRIAGDPGDALLRLDLRLSDRATGVALEDRIAVGVGRPLPVFAERRAPVVTADDPPPERTGARTLRLRATIADETAVKDAFVLAGGRKILYRSAGAAPGRRLEIDVEVPLAPGPNRVEVVGRDGDDLTASRVFLVFRTAE